MECLKENCIHHAVCALYTFSGYNSDECGFYEPERPHGEWVRTTVGNTEFINCKNCGCGCPLYSYVKKGEKEEKVQHYETDFCPNCGADMREGDKNE